MKRNLWMIPVLAGLCGFLGCTFPQAEAKYQAKVLREQGREMDAERIERQAQDAPAAVITTSDPLQPALNKDPYDFPDHAHDSDQKDQNK